MMKPEEFSRGRKTPAALLLVIACLTFAGPVSAQTGGSNLPIPAVIRIPAGTAVIGSDGPERNKAYELDRRAYGTDITRRQRWYDSENPRRTVTVNAFAITRTPITNRQYAAFIAATGHRVPVVKPRVWKSYGLIHPFGRTLRHAWLDGRPPKGRAHHPVVLVSNADARAYAAWLTRATGKQWRLPTALELEIAARGRDGRIFPWGNDFDPARLNSADLGPDDTTPVGSFPQGASPFGLLDAAGQVYEWTSTPAGSGRFTVKGGGWDDKGCGVCRPAAAHGRPIGIKHILIGFRLVLD
jgi:formylglycine-generating enzyme required for sulfatase activity